MATVVSTPVFIEVFIEEKASIEYLTPWRDPRDLGYWLPGTRRYYVDVIVAVSVLVTAACCWLSYHSRHATRSQTERIMKDLASLQSAEDSLKLLQKQFSYTVFPLLLWKLQSFAFTGLTTTAWNSPSGFNPLRIIRLPKSSHSSRPKFSGCLHKFVSGLAIWNKEPPTGYGNWMRK